MNPKFHVIIPARYASVRLPGKPLCMLGGKPMIEWVIDAARKSAALSVVVATDDVRIGKVAELVGVPFVMTDQTHTSGSDRIAEAVQILDMAADDIIVNVQGDEPDMPPTLINQMAALLQKKDQAVMATACVKIDDDQQLNDPSVVKVVCNKHDYALYFSRAPIAKLSGHTTFDPPEKNAQIAMRHLGIYAYRASFIKYFASLKAAPIEQYENLEQLRVLWYGAKIACAEVLTAPGPGIDTEDDLNRAYPRFVDKK